MMTSPYKSLMETSSRLADIELFDDVDASRIDDAVVLLERLGPILDSAQNTLRQRCEVPIEYTPDFFSHHMDNFQHLRNLAQAFRFACDVAAYHEDFASVAQYGMTLLELANASRRGGLIVDHSFSNAISGIGVNCLRTVRTRYDDDIRRELIASLCRCENGREPFDVIARRDAKWTAESGCENDGSEPTEDEFIDPDSELSVDDQKALSQFIEEFRNLPESEIETIYVGEENRALALTRLLAVDLAIRCRHETVGRYPASIAGLSSGILLTPPRDPFTDREFIYRTTADSFTLYSTGPDETDCGGRFGSWLVVSCGGFDLCLDANDYPPDCCEITGPRRQGLLRRLFSTMWSWLRPGT